MKHVRKFLANNKSHKWGSSKRLHQAIGKVGIPLHAGVITRDNLIEYLAKHLAEKKIDPQELKRGIEVEKEHGDHDPKTDVFKGSDAKSKKGFEKIAKAHLKELPDYYTRLDKMEKEGKKAVKESTQDERKAKLKKWGKRVAVGAAVAGGGALVYHGAKSHQRQARYADRQATIAQRVRHNVANSRASREAKLGHIPPGAGRKMHGIGLRDVNKYRSKDRTLKGNFDKTVRAITHGKESRAREAFTTGKSMKRHYKKIARKGGIHVRESQGVEMTREELIEAVVESMFRRSRASIKKKYQHFDHPEAGVYDQRDVDTERFGMAGYTSRQIVQSANSRERVASEKMSAQSRHTGAGRWRRGISGKGLSRKDIRKSYKSRSSDKWYPRAERQQKRTHRATGGKRISASNYNRYSKQYNEA
jgi:hypothetical protein